MKVPREGMSTSGDKGPVLVPVPLRDTQKLTMLHMFYLQRM